MGVLLVMLSFVALGFAVGRMPVAAVAPPIVVLWFAGLGAGWWGDGVGDGWAPALVVVAATATLATTAGVLFRRLTRPGRRGRTT